MECVTGLISDQGGIVNECQLSTEELVYILIYSGNSGF